MKRTHILLLTFVSVALVSCTGVRPVKHFKDGESSQTVAQRQLLIGSWRGEAPVKTGGKRTWIIERKSDGTFQVDFTHTDQKGMVFKQSEAGIWGTSAGYYFTATRAYVDSRGATKVDTTDPTFYDVYKITKLSSDEFEYRNLSTGNQFVTKRVSDAS